MKNFILYLFIAVNLLLFASCEKPVSEMDSISQQFCIPDSLMLNLTYDTLKNAMVMSSIKLFGKITYDEDKVVKIFPLVSGHVADVKVSLGDYVSKGQLLAVVNSTEIAGYFSDYESAKVELANAKKNLEVVTDMKATGVSSDRDLLNAQNEYQKALASYNKMNSIMKIYGESMQDNNSADAGYMIKSPISGFIVDKNVNAGMELRPDDSNSLFTISDLNEVWAIANVYETDISKIQKGNDVQITTLSYPDKVFTGKVERISNILNPETNSMSVRIRLENPGYLLKPGMFAELSVLFPGNEKMLSVKASAVLFDENKNYVVLFRKRCETSFQEVEVLKSFNNIDYINADSLKESDLVIDRNNLFVFTALKKL